MQNLFHSVQLNVNNPHFLIMQGRITKVLVFLRRVELFACRCHPPRGIACCRGACHTALRGRLPMRHQLKCLMPAADSNGHDAPLYDTSDWCSQLRKAYDVPAPRQVLNMKPAETLGMLEEAAGTRMYEMKKEGALRTLDKKQLKVDEIEKVSLCGPTLQFQQAIADGAAMQHNPLKSAVTGKCSRCVGHHVCIALRTTEACMMSPSRLVACKPRMEKITQTFSYFPNLGGRSGLSRAGAVGGHHPGTGAPAQGACRVPGVPGRQGRSREVDAILRCVQVGAEAAVRATRLSSTTSAQPVTADDSSQRRAPLHETVSA